MAVATIYALVIWRTNTEGSEKCFAGSVVTVIAKGSLVNYGKMLNL